MEESETRTIHPETLKEINERLALAFLEVARDLESGVINDRLFSMWSFSETTHCGTSHCIAGWIATYLYSAGSTFDVEWQPLHPNPNHRKFFSERQDNLFMHWGANPTPKRAAKAIEAYIYNFAEDPWMAIGKV